MGVLIAMLNVAWVILGITGVCLMTGMCCHNAMEHCCPEVLEDIKKCTNECYKKLKAKCCPKPNENHDEEALIDPIHLIQPQENNIVNYNNHNLNEDMNIQAMPMGAVLEDNNL